jgi:GNAT superfamily N-acetyltransferase
VRLELRAAVADDEAVLREFLYLALYVPPGSSPLPRSVLSEPAISRYVDGWGTRPGDRGLIAMVEGTPVGAAWLRLFTPCDPGYGFVDESTPELSIAVVPEFRSRGVGTALIRDLLRDGCSVSLSCDPLNPAWNLYLRFGFEPLPDGRTMVRRSPGVTVLDSSNRL